MQEDVLKRIKEKVHNLPSNPGVYKMLDIYGNIIYTLNGLNNAFCPSFSKEKFIDLIKNLDTISASYLQRKFGMGFPKAGRYIDRLEKEGYIGEQQGSKPREVLKRD